MLVDFRLQENQTLVHLDLRSNNASPQGVERFFAGLASGQRRGRTVCLAVVDVRSNGVDAETALVIRRDLKDAGCETVAVFENMPPDVTARTALLTGYGVRRPALAYDHSRVLSSQGRGAVRVPGIGAGHTRPLR